MEINCAVNVVSMPQMNAEKNTCTNHELSVLPGALNSVPCRSSWRASNSPAHSQADRQPSAFIHSLCHDVTATIPVNALIVDYREASDEALVEAAKNKDEAAFAELSTRYSRAIRKKVFSIVRNAQDAEDVLQDTLIKAYMRLHQFRGASTFSTWVLRIGINSALMLLRRRRARPEVSYEGTVNDDKTRETWDFPDPSPTAEQNVATRQNAERISRALEALPAGLQGVVQHYHGEECSVKEAADALGISVAAAKSRLLRARLMLRASLTNGSFPKRSAENQVRQTVQA